jgi:SAM-dependent methyltransferase
MSMVGAVPPVDAAAVVFGQIYRVVRPRHLLIPGCGSCAGLDVVDPEVTTRVVGVDADIQYVAMARQRYRRLGPVLEMYCGDPLRARLQPSADFDLVHLPLLDERLDALEVCREVPRWISPGGVCSLLLPADGAALARLSEELSLSGLRRAGAWSYGLPGPSRGTVALFRAPGRRAGARDAGDDAATSAQAAAK